MQSSRDTIADLVQRLRTAVSGRLITPEDPDYDRARAIFSGLFDRRPAVIVRPVSDAEVASVVTAARESGAPLAVRGGGHSAAGHSVVDNGIVLDLRDLRELRIDASGRTAWAEAGLTAGEYTAAAGEHGLATGFGDSGTVGVGGITLAGGQGFLSRKHGLTIDSLLAADIVTADGQRLRVDADHHSDLFWAIRGGGGGLGVATRFHYRLHDVSEFTGGVLVLPAAPEVITGFVAAAQGAPEELTTIMMAMTAPPMPFLPAELHGTPVVMGLMAYAGPAEAAAQALAPFRALAPPLVDMVQPMPYSGMFQPEEEDLHPTAASRSLFLDDIDDTLAATILDQVRGSTASMAAVQLRVLGGAIARVPDDATAYGHRQRRIMANVAAMYQQPGEAAEHEAWVAKLAATLSQGQPGVYVGFLGDEGPERVREAYPGATGERLAEVKRRYDPGNLFRSAHTIPAP